MKLRTWSFVALASIACATDVSIDSQYVQSQSLDSRATANCPDKFTSLNGLNFTTYCNQNTPNNDVYIPFKMDTMELCMERCSRYGENGSGCYAVVWNEEDTNCWIKNSSTSTAGLTNLTGTHSAFPQQSQLEPLDTDCPFADNSVQTLDTGEAFTIRCNKRVDGYDYCPLEYPQCNPGPFFGFWHTDTLSECIELCRQTHPLCRAVNWSPVMAVGYGNCWPKSGFENGIQTPTDGVRHLATLSGTGDTVNTTCPTNKYTSNGKSFDVHCGQFNSGTNITSLHRANISSCMDACATSNEHCVAIMFDSTLLGGFQNCYLQNSTSVVSASPNVTYAPLSGTAAPTSSGSVDPAAGDQKSSSKAWIAGAVIGAIAVIGLIAGGLFWWRRRKTKPSYSQGKPPEYQYAHEADTHPPYLQGTAMNEMDTRAPPVELGGANYPAEKKHRSVQSQPQELP